MKALDKAALAVMRRVRRRRRAWELEDLALPGPGRCVGAEIPAERHTAQRGGAPGTLTRSRSLRIAVVAVVVAGIPMAYAVGATTATAAATEEADRAVIEEASAEYHAAQMRAAEALSAATAAYSAEREVSGGTVPAEEAMEALVARGLTEAEAEEEIAGWPGTLGPSHEELEAERMWKAEPPATEVAEERIRKYEDAARAAEEARVNWESARDERR